jgi:cytochrome P450 monooxygenase
MDAFIAALRDVILPVHKRPKDYNDRCKLVLDYIDNCIDGAYSRLENQNQEEANVKQVRIIDELAKATNDRYSLRYLIVSIFSPAHHSVAVTLSNAFFHLARNPQCWKRLREEILPTASQPLTYELLNSYKYLNWVLRESEYVPSEHPRKGSDRVISAAHRLTPLNAGTVRECLSTTVIPSGGGKDGYSPLLVQKGDLIEVNFRAQHRDKSFWGDDADEFVPERWARIRPTWEYIPFSGGPRICPAFKLVYTECEYIMVTMVRQFSRLENRDEVNEWVEERRLTFQSRNGAKVGLIV